jgi:hypothetical protein
VGLAIDGIEADLVYVASDVKGLPVPSQADVKLRRAISSLQNDSSPLIDSQIMSAFLPLFE